MFWLYVWASLTTVGCVYLGFCLIEERSRRKSYQKTLYNYLNPTHTDKLMCDVMNINQQDGAI